MKGDNISKSVFGRVIIIDDDPINNFILFQNIKFISPALPVFEFISPSEALRYIASAILSDCSLVLLDINMPQLSGWEFLHELTALTIPLKNKFEMYMLSSSTDISDQKMAHEHVFVKDYLIKPITIEKLRKILLKRGKNL
ncbi:MAG: response regulator [Bacteroidetes bacterium]|nr:response regulator [Bacteroidota bacterium]